MWTIVIDDGYCAHEFILDGKNHDVCIRDIYNIVRNKLDAPERESTLVRGYGEPYAEAEKNQA